MKKICAFGAVVLLFVLGSCNESNENPTEEVQNIELKNFSNTGCKNNEVRTRSGENGWTDVFEDRSIRDGYLYVTHKDVHFNCCPGELKADVSAEGNRITVREWSTEDECDCICTFDLSYEIGPLVEGATYSLWIEYKGEVSQVAEFKFSHSMSGVWKSLN